MTDDSKYRQYYEEIARVDSYALREIENHGKAAYEYGILIQKHLFLLYGGSLIAIPAILQSSPNVTTDNAYSTASWFFVSIILLTVCTYAVHLNWTFNHSLSLHDRVLEHWQALERVWGPDEKAQEEIENLKKKIKSTKTRIKITFYFPHLFGIISVITYVIGGAQFIQSVATG